MMTQIPKMRPSGFAARLSLVLAIVAALGLFVFPYATLARNFSGAATLWHFTGSVLDFSGFGPKDIPSFGTTVLFAWLTCIAVLAMVYAAFTRQSWLWITGVLAMSSSLLAIFSFNGVLDAEVQRLLAEGIRKNRLPFRQYGMNIGMFTPFLAGMVAVVAGLSAYPVWQNRFERFRGGLIPLVSILLSMVVGCIVILLVQSVPKADTFNLTFATQWLGKVDLLWFVYATLFSPLTKLSDLFQSLMLATPLIFTGLSVAFGFRAGLFNIGAPGQMIMGAIFAMLVGVYAPLPAFLLLPATILAAALGGAFWGFIPGYLKARFGSSEVINTIMLNYVASGILVFMLGSNQFAWFGQKYNLPFKAEGYETKSQELQEGARLGNLPELLGLGREVPFLTLAPLLGLLVFVLLYYWFMRSHKQRLAIAAGVSVLLTALCWGWLGISITGQGSLTGVNLNTAFLLALVMAVLFGIYMWRTASGYEVRAVGLAPKAAEYGGINVAKNVILAMVIAGALAGLAATHYVMGGALDEYRLKLSIPSNIGFDGITIALLGQSTPLGVVISSILFGVLDTGGLYADQSLDALNKDIVTVLKALIVLFIAAQGFLSKRITSPPPAVLVKESKA